MLAVTKQNEVLQRKLRIANALIDLQKNVPAGYAVSIDHGDRTTITHYAHLSKMFVTPCIAKTVRREFVRAGQVIGYTARSPLHIRFELWRWTDEDGYVAIDPMAELATWSKALTSVDVREPGKEVA